MLRKLTLIGLLIFLTSPARAEPIVTIRGHVLNGTFDRRPLPGRFVQVVRMSREGVVIASVRTNANGEFTARIPESDGTYVVVARHGEVEYASEPFRLKPGPPARINVVVYEPTTLRPPLVFPFRIVLIDRFGAGVISVREVVAIANPWPRTYIGQRSPQEGFTLTLALPQGAEAVEVLRGLGSASLEKGRLIDRAPLQPGEHEIAYAYQVRYWGTKARLRWALDEDTGSMDVFAPDQGERLASNVLEAKPSGMVKGQRFLRLARDELRSGEVVEVIVTGLPGNYSPVVPFLAIVLAVVLSSSTLMAIRKAKKDQISSMASD
ncbi:MAG: carboxypeptidase-like regulatory domain-containing protein [bacterium]